MGKRKHLDRIEEMLLKSPVISTSAIARVVRAKKQGSQYHKQLIRNLINGGRISRLAKGCYTAHADPSLIVFCLKPAYLGLQDALSFHGLWEQETVPVIITQRKVRSGLRKVMGANVVVRRIERKHLFGFGYQRHGDFYVPVSDIEKSFIDMVYFRQVMGKEAIEAFREKIDERKLKSYLLHYDKRLRDRVMEKLAFVSK